MPIDTNLSSLICIESYTDCICYLISRYFATLYTWCSVFTDITITEDTRHTIQIVTDTYVYVIQKTYRIMYELWIHTIQIQKHTANSFTPTSSGISLKITERTVQPELRIIQQVKINHLPNRTKQFEEVAETSERDDKRRIIRNNVK